MRARLLASTVGGAVFAASAFSSAPAHGDSSGSISSAESVARIVEDQAPANATVGATSAAQVSESEQGAIRSGAVALPETGDGDLAVGEVTIGLPSEFDLGEVELTEDAIAVYEGNSGNEPSVAIASDADSTAVHAVLPNASSPMRHSYEIQGATPQLLDDGSVALIGPDGESLGFVEAPWAADAAGSAVPTHYTVEGQTLVQVVEPSAQTEFPVVADPDLWFMAKCTGAVALFAAENAAVIGKFWRVFKSAKRVAEIFWDIRSMSRAGKLSYLRTQLGSVFSELTGIGDLVSRCTP